MRKIVFWIVLSIFFSQTAISQYVDQTRGGNFLKRTEFNIALAGVTEDALPCYNLQNKSIVERILFDNTNSFVEFVAENSPKDNIRAFRIVKDRKEYSYKLQIMQIPSADQLYYTTEKYISEKKTKIVIPDEWLSKIPEEIRDSISKHNEEAALYNSKCGDRGLFKPYHPESKEYTVGKEFSEKLHDTIAMLIDNFRAEGIPVSAAVGYPLHATFRCVVGAEVWSLKITAPQRRALLLSDICTQIMNDALNNEINETEYIRKLEEIEKLGLTKNDQ
ncbi:MAG: hypothetical protein LIO93_06475 [Bacteroidales bacterium]|nr:hypothetical protein [Bacteroidales bacterium]